MKTSRFISVSLLCLALAGCKVQLNADLAERDANEIMAHLLANGIVANKIENEDAMFNIVVPKSQFSAAVDTINAVGLPRRAYTNTGEMFKSEGLVASPMQEHARYTYAKSQELAESISSIPGVVSVDVHIASPRAEKPFEIAAKPSVSVMLKMNRAQMSEDIIPQIKHLVSMGVENVEYERVGVVLTSVDPVVMTAEFANVAGLSVHRSSVNLLKMSLAGVLGGFFFVALLAALAVRRARRFNQRGAIE